MSEEYFVYEISEEMFYPNLYRFVWRRHAGAHLYELQHGGRKPTETSATKFCYKNVNLFFEKLNKSTQAALAHVAREGCNVIYIQ